MRALVVFESMFGNTQRIATEIAVGLGSRMSVDIVEVGGATASVPDGVDLVVVGGPTHAFGLTRERTRADAAQQADGPLVSRGIGLREWLDAARDGAGIAAAAFDTRIAKPRLPGSAAKGAAKRLRHLGFRVVAPAESFYVSGTLGPLVDGEVDRARRWGESLAAAIVPAVTASLQD